MVASSVSSAFKTEQFESGDVIADKYRLERILGEGGQACVWQARNLSLDVDVAIKFVRLCAEDTAQAARLLVEARTAAQLRHPGIVRVFDFGQTPSGEPFLVMELLEGESLARALISSTRLTPEHAIRILLPIAEAVSSAHARGIVHRDIKPENVFLALQGDQVQPKLLDFGIAKVGETLALPAHLTRVGAVVGSPAYLSPEQARGESDTDHRADIWSFSATLYQCITGQLPFSASTYNALLRAIVEDEPTPTVDFGVGDDALWRIIRRGLSKSRESRWSSIHELGAALAEWLIGRGIHDDVCGVPLAVRWLNAAHTPLHVTPLPAVPRSFSEAPQCRGFGTTSVINRPRSLTPSTCIAPSTRARSHAMFSTCERGRGRTARLEESGSGRSPLSLSLSRSVTVVPERGVRLGSALAALAVSVIGCGLLWLGPELPRTAAARTANASLATSVSAADVTTIATPARVARENTMDAPLDTSEPRVFAVVDSTHLGELTAPAASPFAAPAPSSAPSSEGVVSTTASPRKTATKLTATLAKLSAPSVAKREHPETDLMNPY